VLDLGQEPRKLDTSEAWRCIELAFSPDGRWLAYVWSPKASTMIVRIADCESGTVADATGSPARRSFARLDPEGKYLYFISARDFNPIYDALQFDLSFPHAMRPFVVTLRRDVPNPFVAVPAPLHHAKDDDDEDDDGRRRRRRQTQEGAQAYSDRHRWSRAAYPRVSGRRRQLRAGRGREGPRALLAVPGERHQAVAPRRRRRRRRLVAYDFTAERSATLAGDIDGFVLGSDARTLVYESHGNCARLTPAANCPKTIPKKSPRPKPTAAAAGSIWAASAY